MKHEEYIKKIDNAIKLAGGGPEWNAIFELNLLKQGLKIVYEQPVKHPDGNDYMAPYPVSGERYTYQYPSWIVEA